MRRCPSARARSRTTWQDPPDRQDVAGPRTHYRPPFALFKYASSYHAHCMQGSTLANGGLTHPCQQIVLTQHLFPSHFPIFMVSFPTCARVNFVRRRTNSGPCNGALRRRPPAPAAAPRCICSGDPRPAHISLLESRLAKQRIQARMYGRECVR